MDILTRQLINLLLANGEIVLATRLQEDYANPNGNWHQHTTPNFAICSFLYSYVDHDDQCARLTLCPSNEAQALVEEIYEELLPKIRQRLGAHLNG